MVKELEKKLSKLILNKTVITPKYDSLRDIGNNINSEKNNNCTGLKDKKQQHKSSFNFFKPTSSRMNDGSNIRSLSSRASK